MLFLVSVFKCKFENKGFVCPDLSGKYLCALISMEVEVLLKFSDEAPIPTALSLYCCNHSSSLTLFSAASLMALFSVEQAEFLDFFFIQNLYFHHELLHQLALLNEFEVEAL